MPLADVQKMTCLTHSTLKRPVEELEFTLMRASYWGTWQWLNLKWCVSFRKSQVGFLNPKESEMRILRFITRQINPRSQFRIMMRQRNRRIHSGRGFLGSFDAPWSGWSWIDLPVKKRKIHFRILLDLRLQFYGCFSKENPRLDF